MFLNEDSNLTRSDVPTRSWAIAVGVCMLPVYIVFSSFGMRGRGTIAGCALATLVLLVRMHRELARKSWFWVVMAVIVVIHILLLIYTPIPNKDFVYAVVAPIGFADYYLCSLLIRMLDQRLQTSSSALPSTQGE